MTGRNIVCLSGALGQNAQTLDVLERQRIVRLLVKEVVVGQDSITIRHSIPKAMPSTGGNMDSTGPLGSPEHAQSNQSYLLSSGRDSASMRFLMASSFVSPCE
jgi:site-specific DNA recombinase